MNSFAPEVSTDGSGKFYGNNLRFATEKEAQHWLDDLVQRWFAVRNVRAVSSSDPVNAAIVENKLVML